MKKILRNLRSMGKTILISSHILPERAEMCSSIGIIEHGKMAVKGTVQEIMNTMNASNPLVIKVLDGQDYAIRLLKENPLVENVSIKEGNISIGFRGGEKEEATLLHSLISSEVRIHSFAREEGNLESLFMQITEKDEAMGGAGNEN